jgi:hypothetical protein
MDQDYRWFRQDELVRKCTVTNAYFATQGGFETVLEADDPGQYSFVKEKINERNKAVNMDLALFVAQVKSSVHGKAGFEVILNEKMEPAKLLSLQSARLKPDLSEDWKLTGYTY